MKGKKHKPEQIIRKLREADAMLSADKSIGQVCQALEISEQTFNRWRNQYGGMKAEEAKRLKELEGENKRLKKLLAEAELDNATVKTYRDAPGVVESRTGCGPSRPQAPNTFLMHSRLSESLAAEAKFFAVRAPLRRSLWYCQGSPSATVSSRPDLSASHR